MIKYVLLDLDDTVLDFGYSEEVALRQLLVEYGIDPTEDALRRYSEINASYWKRLETGELTRQQVQEGRFEQFYEEQRQILGKRI